MKNNSIEMAVASAFEVWTKKVDFTGAKCDAEIEICVKGYIVPFMNVKGEVVELSHEDMRAAVLEYYPHAENVIIIGTRHAYIHDAQEWKLPKPTTDEWWEGRVSLEEIYVDYDEDYDYSSGRQPRLRRTAERVANRQKAYAYLPEDVKGFIGSLDFEASQTADIKEKVIKAFTTRRNPSFRIAIWVGAAGRGSWLEEKPKPIRFDETLAAHYICGARIVCYSTQRNPKREWNPFWRRYVDYVNLKDEVTICEYPSERV